MTSISRRNLLRAGVAGGVAGLAGGSLFEAPAFSSAGVRPLLTHGVQSGDATADRRSSGAGRTARPGSGCRPVANTSPADGYQHFGEIGIDAHSGAMTVDLRDRDGVSLWSTTLHP